MSNANIPSGVADLCGWRGGSAFLGKDRDTTDITDFEKNMVN